METTWTWSSPLSASPRRVQLNGVTTTVRFNINKDTHSQTCINTLTHIQKNTNIYNFSKQL